MEPLDERRPRRVAYLMTHYPNRTQTFLYNEVLTVQNPEIEITPIALNSPAPIDVVTPEEHREAARTLYVKATPKVQVLRVVARMARRDVIGFLRLVLGAVRSAGFDLSGALWQVFYAIEAAIVWDHCEREGCRHIHAQFGSAPATVAMLAAELGNRVSPGPVPVTWSFSMLGHHEFTAEAKLNLSGKTSSAAFVIAISDYTRSQLMRSSRPSDWPKIHVVRCGVDVERFVFAPRARAQRPATVLTVGRLMPEKGHFVLLEAAGLLIGRGVDVRFMIVGHGPDADDLRQRAVALGVADAVEFTGPLPAEEVLAALAAADVFCLASFGEGIPVAIMEALACGIPVASTYIGGIPELIEDGVSGRVVPAGRADLLADAVESLINDDALRARVQQEGRRRVERLHDAHDFSAGVRRLLLVPEPGPLHRRATPVADPLV